MGYDEGLVQVKKELLKHLFSIGQETEVASALAKKQQNKHLVFESLQPLLPRQ